MNLAAAAADDQCARCEVTALEACELRLSARLFRLRRLTREKQIPDARATALMLAEDLPAKPDLQKFLAAHAGPTPAH